MSRDDFKLLIVRGLANRAGHRCSNPDCRRDTSGPASTVGDAINIGVAAVSWLPFSARATVFVGRDVEREKLKRFIRSDAVVSWMLLLGAAGTGKSRLAVELCHAIRPEWNAGLLS